MELRAGSRCHSQSLAESRRYNGRRPWPALLAPLLALAAGCSGSAMLEIISLQPNAIDPPPPGAFRHDADQCYWWTADNGELAIAMQFDRVSLLAAIPRSTLKLSFLFDKPPEGQGRDYPVRRREIRGLYQVGLQQDRFMSLQGICSVVREKNGDRLNGSFRLWLLHQPGPGLFDLFPRQPGQLLFQGRFEAVPDQEGRGRAIMAETESAGWNRTPLRAPSSQRTIVVSR